MHKVNRAKDFSRRLIAKIDIYPRFHKRNVCLRRRLLEGFKIVSFLSTINW